MQLFLSKGRYFIHMGDRGIKIKSPLKDARIAVDEIFQIGGITQLAMN